MYPRACTYVTYTHVRRLASLQPSHFSFPFTLTIIRRVQLSFRMNLKGEPTSSQISSYIPDDRDYIQILEICRPFYLPPNNNCQPCNLPPRLDDVLVRVVTPSPQEVSRESAEFARLILFLSLSGKPIQGRLSYFAN
jgi:hypothetical protein